MDMMEAKNELARKEMELEIKALNLSQSMAKMEEDCEESLKGQAEELVWCKVRRGARRGWGWQ